MGVDVSNQSFMSVTVFFLFGRSNALTGEPLKIRQSCSGMKADKHAFESSGSSSGGGGSEEGWVDTIHPSLYSKQAEKIQDNQVAIVAVVTRSLRYNSVVTLSCLPCIRPVFAPIEGISLASARPSLRYSAADLDDIAIQLSRAHKRNRMPNVRDRRCLTQRTPQFFRPFFVAEGGRLEVVFSLATGLLATGPFHFFIPRSTHPVPSVRDSSMAPGDRCKHNPEKVSAVSNRT